MLPSQTSFNNILSYPLSKFFDKAAIVAPSSGDKGVSSSRSPWRLCTVSQVEELKMLLQMFPIWTLMVLFFAVTEQASSTFIEQGMTMDNRAGAFTVPPASLATFHTATIIVEIPINDVLAPLLSQLHCLGVGLALSVAAMAYAALLKARRLQAMTIVAMSIMWQAPAFAVLGAAEVFTTVGVLEFFYDQSSGDMKSLGTSLAHLAMAAGYYLNSAVLGAVARGWIPDDLNEGHLDYFFWLIAALSVVNLMHFLHCSRRYRRNKTACS